MKGMAVSLMLFVLVFFVLSESEANVQPAIVNSVNRKRRAVLKDSEISDVVNAHNMVRRREGSSNMKILSYNNDLASMADAWANKCQWYHGQAVPIPSSLGVQEVGQNLYAVTGASSINITNITLTWYYEKNDYNYDTGTCQQNRMCGHYTQVVWANTGLIGCAYTTCQNLNQSGFTASSIFFVCNYAPAGNWVGQKPFLKGTPCSQCSNSYWCNNGLCDESCTPGRTGCVCPSNIICQNYGAVNSDRCACDCMSGYSGSDCSVCTIMCKNNGVVNRDRCSCDCPYGYCGSDCSRIVPAKPSNRLRCVWRRW